MSDTEHTKSPKNATRASTKDIDDAIHQLQAAFEDGRLDEKEFDERVSSAVKVKTHEDISELLHDLRFVKPTVIDPKRGSTSRVLGNETVVIFSGLERKGHFFVPKTYHITVVFGGASLDFREAVFESDITEIQIEAILGGVEIFVPKGMSVQVDGMPILGGISNKIINESLPPDAPIINIKATAILGGIEVKG